MADITDTTATIKVKPWGKDQGDFVEINANDFDPKIHTKAGEKAADPLDHDKKDGKGGSLKGAESTAAKGAAKRKAKK